MKGSIVKFKDGYRVFVSGGVDPETDKRIRVSKYVPGSKSEARKWLTKIQSDLDSGKILRRGPKTVSEFIDSWWPMKKSAISPTTARGYRGLIDRYVLPEFGSTPLQTVQGIKIQKLIKRLINSGKTGQASHLFVLLRLVFNAAIKMEDLAVNPVAGLEKPRTDRHEMSILTPADWQIVRNHLIESGSWALLPLTVLITTGLRRSELAGLKWSDLNESQGLLHIQRSYHVLKGGIGVVRPPKTNRSRRAVALDPETLAALLEHKYDRMRIAKLADTEIGLDNPMFARSDGSPWRPDTYSRLWSRMMKVLQLDLSATPRLHDLRHTSASLLLAAGVDTKLISTRLGHSSVAFTMDTYAHLLPEANNQAAVKLARILGGHPESFNRTIQIKSGAAG